MYASTVINLQPVLLSLAKNPLIKFRSVGYARPSLGVSADLQSAVKKCPNHFMLWGYVIPSNQAVASISMG